MQFPHKKILKKTKLLHEKAIRLARLIDEAGDKPDLGTIHMVEYLIGCMKSISLDIYEEFI